MKKFNNLESKKRILVIASIILFLLVSSLAVLYSVIDISKSRKMASKYLTSITNGVSETVDSWMEEKKKMVMFISEMPEIKEALSGDMNHLNQRFQLIGKHYPNQECIFLASKDGVILTDSSFMSLYKIDYVHQLPFWKSFKDNGFGIYLDTHISRSEKSNKLIFTIIKGVFSSNNELCGFIGITINWDKFVKKFIIPVRVGETGFVAITDLDGRNIGHPDKSLALEDLSGYAWMQNMITQKDGSQEYTFCSENKMMAFRQSKESGWIVNSSINEDELIKQTIYIRNLILLISIVILFSLLFVIVYMDMFKLEAAEKNLIESERNFKLLFERGSDGIFVHEINKNGIPGHFTKANRIFLKLFQCKESELYNDSSCFVFEGNGRDEYMKVLSLMVQSKYHVMDCELSVKGQRLIVEFRLFLIESAQSYAVMGFVRDITESVISRLKLAEHRDSLDKKVQERTKELMTSNMKLINQIKAKEEMAKALIESENKYRSLIERANDGIMLVQDKQILYVNKNMAHLLEYGDQEVCKMTFDQIIPENHWIDIYSNYQQRLKGNNEKYIYETQFLSCSGKPLDVEVNAGIINYEGKSVDFLFVRDIAERKKIEEEKRKHQEQLLQTDKLVALGTLVSGVAHEINNPNSSIMLGLPILKQGWDGALPILDSYLKANGDFLIAGIPFIMFKSYVSDIMRDISKCSERIKVIVNDLKNFSRFDSGELSDHVDVGGVIHASIKLINSQILKCTNKFQVKIEDDMPCVFGNIIRLEQVFVNLIQNACQALTCSDQAIVISVNYNLDQQNIQVLIEDEGCGISKFNMKQIFDPFYTTKRGVGGTGLGLSVSLKIIEEHKGSIDFYSNEGKGTQVVILLPVIQNQKKHGII